MSPSVFFTVLAALITVVPAVAADRSSSPNVVILYADDMGIGDVGCYGCTDIQTPNLDRLAAEGVRFTNYYSAAPICSPSRAALLTGKHPARAGVPSNVSSLPGDSGMPTQQVTIAELAKSRGYATGLIGKWHLGYSDDTIPNAQGFDFFFGHHAGCIDYYSHMFYWQNPPHHDLFRNRQEIREEGQYMTDIVAREACRFIDEHHERPFLLYVAFNAPHYPMQTPQVWIDKYASLPPKRRIYAAMVSAMDDAIGKLLAALQQHDLTRDTIVFFASDNGATTELRGNGSGGSNAPFRGHKFSLFEGGIHLPAILRWPAGRIQPESVRDIPVIAMDLLPTVAEAIGAEPPPDIDGQSWLNFSGHETLFWALGGQSAVRRGQWKLIRNVLITSENDRQERATGEDAIFLADLEADPGETKNLRRTHPDIVQDLSAALDGWLADLPSEPGRAAPSKKE